ncbi:hypothetical protein SAMN05421770_103385 [Granulicella rosea]|uniref:Uncharacterized protein n=1 Tax=Granulicella rosea TaxID=474952 RepID=A0A239J1Z8_9BACT|nr:hypothetical protein [Granulicella rosea]SNS99488.1 hypothetical protein SAMN05421770_103385 [Granulicella rosea]
MSSVADDTAQGAQNHPVDRDLVTLELDAILGSSFFRGSKRYPALLKYVVVKTLEGQADDLKERTLGVEVFGRTPSYDTNADPVVRSSASEVRKRLAQYYKDHAEECRLKIDLPLGSYVPEFRTMAAPPETPVLPEALPELPIQRTNHSFLWIAVVAIVAVALTSAITVYRWHRPAPATVTDKLWGPLLHAPTPVLIVVGTSDFGESHERPPEAGSTDRLRSPYHHVSMSCALALARVVGFLQSNGKAYVIKDDREVSLTDFRSRPVVLIGARNNPWTMRLTDPLRFRFDYGSLSKVEDRTNPSASDWGQHPSTDSYDYAIFARYHDATTNGTVMVIAGLGTFGTESASEFAVSTQYLDQLTTKGPAGWGEKNLELVIKTEDISGEAAPPHVVSATSW